MIQSHDSIFFDLYAQIYQALSKVRNINHGAEFLDACIIVCFDVPFPKMCRSERAAGGALDVAIGESEGSTFEFVVVSVNRSKSFAHIGWRNGAKVVVDLLNELRWQV